MDRRPIDRCLFSNFAHTDLGRDSSSFQPHHIGLSKSNRLIGLDAGVEFRSSGHSQSKNNDEPAGCAVSVGTSFP